MQPDTTIPTQLLQELTPGQAWHYQVVPKAANATDLELRIAANRPQQETLREELELVTGKSISFDPVDEESLRQLLARHYRKEQEVSKVASLHPSDSDDFLIRLIRQAREMGSSDIHLESYDEDARIRLRVDGQLIEQYALEKTDVPALVNKIKIKSHLDIAEKRLPQDGRMQIQLSGDKLDVRVSVLPTLYGEKVVLRLLSNDATNIDLKALGMTPKQLADYQQAIRQPNGLILISGPTGSGKTTTLYATLKLLNQPNRNILTIEDPVEYTLKGINQVQLNEKIGLTFARALRSFLRQDPNTVMLGEIRDGETAQMATRAALTGRLVLSTIHTNSAWGTITRLIDMGLPAYLVANTLHLSVAQRLIRLLCPHCKSGDPPEGSFFQEGGLASFPLPDQLFEAVGCEACHYTGYEGRTALYEVIPMDAALTKAIRQSAFEVDDLLKERNISRLSEQAYEQLALGNTSLEEVYPLLLNQP